MASAAGRGRGPIEPEDSTLRALLHLSVVFAFTAGASEALAQVNTSSVSPGAPRFEAGANDRDAESARAARPSAHDPMGSIVASGTLGLSSGADGTSFVLGAGVGYAVMDGLVPGLRAFAVLGPQSGGEITATLTYTLSANWYVSPFILVEGGRRWLGGLEGWVLGGGGGLRLGYPASRISLRLGWVLRRFYVSGFAEPADVSAPLFGVQIRF